MKPINVFSSISPKRWLTATTATLALTLMGIAGTQADDEEKYLTLKPIGTYASGVFDEGAQEIAAYDADSQRVFVVNADASSVDVLDIANPKKPVLETTLDLSDGFNGANSVAVRNGMLAVAVGNTNEFENGSVIFFSTASLENLNTVEVGVLPDMLTFSPDGHYVVVACEGQPSEDYTIDPEGSVSIIDVSNGARNATVTNADFKEFNDQPLPGVRIFGPNATVAQDLEPEYVAITPDSTTAYVALQENNALALVDLASATVKAIVPLGVKNHWLSANRMDASNEDNGIRIRRWPVYGMYQPDSIAIFEAGGHNYIISANEGDSRDYEEFSEEVRVADLTLDRRAFWPIPLKWLQKEKNLGRLKVTSVDGDTDGDGDYDELYSYGARSFSIWGLDGTLIFDSGSELERITAIYNKKFFNSSNDEAEFDDRSDDKGPEPEGVVVAKVKGRTYAFIGLERVGGIVIYDVSDPTRPEFQDYVNNRNFKVDQTTPEAGDLGPEGLLFISQQDSPNGKPLLVVANEVSGTTTIYVIKKASRDDDDDDGDDDDDDDDDGDEDDD